MQGRIAMRMLLLVGLGAASLAAMPAVAQTTAPHVARGPMVSHGGPVMNNNRWNWGHRVNGRWWGGWQAPGGWGAYRRPVVGYVLPGYWLQPSYYISDYRVYGLPAPQAGYGWSRYYDDAVLTDRYGQVHDSRVGYDWERYGGYDDGPRYREDAPRDNGGRAVAGAVIGGVTGGLLGSAIAGPGNRATGAILGAGVGAIAGAAIGDATGERDARYAYDAPGYRYDGTYVDPSRARNERKLAREEAKQRRKLDKMARKAGYSNYDAYMRARDGRYGAYAPHGGPHWAMRGGPEGGPAHGGVHAAPGVSHVQSYTAPGYIANGWYYPGETVTTITIEPTVTTTTKTYVTTSRKVTKRPASKIIKRKIVRRDCNCN
jgi:Ni/Co efflux regulator RcnB